MYFGNALIALDPAHALQDARARGTVRFGLARPGPRVDHPQRLALGRHHVGRVQVQPALGLVAQQAQPGGLLAVKVEFGGVLQAQYHRVLLHARPTGVGMGAQDVVPADFAVAQEAVRRGHLGPVLARPRDARPGLLPQPLGQQHGPTLQPRVSQIDRLKLFFGPAHARAPSMILGGSVAFHRASGKARGLVCNGMRTTAEPPDSQCR